MNRTDVYKIIDTERDYQDNLPPSRTNYEKHTVGDYITMLHFYMRQLDEAWTMNAGNDEALVVMRKIAGIAVHCMEDWGGYPRVVQPVADYSWPLPPAENTDLGEI